MDKVFQAKHFGVMTKTRICSLSWAGQPGFRQVAIFDNQTGEYQAKRLTQRAEAEQFYRSLTGQQVRVGMEACGHYPWCERPLAKLGIELWLGGASKIRAAETCKQKTNRRLLHLDAGGEILPKMPGLGRTSLETGNRVLRGELI